MRLSIKKQSFFKNINKKIYRMKYKTKVIGEGKNGGTLYIKNYIGKYIM